MQILNNKQVDYCNIARQNSDKQEYLPGMSFQNKLYVKEKFFSLEAKSDAMEYCKQKFLQEKGGRSYVLVEDSIGLLVWVEDKTAKVIGEVDPFDFIKEIDLEDLVSQMRSVGGIKIRDRQHNFKTYKQCVIGSEICQYLVDTLELSVEEAVQLGQRLIDEKWIHHVVDQHSFKNERLFYRFYWDED